MSDSKFETAVAEINKTIPSEILSRATEKSKTTRKFNHSYKEVMADIEQRRESLRSNQDPTSS